MAYTVKPVKFTERQIQVIQGLAVSHTYERIAEDMGISDRTVKQHVLTIKAKLGVPHRRDVAAAYYERTGDNPYPR